METIAGKSNMDLRENIKCYVKAAIQHAKKVENLRSHSAESPYFSLIFLRKEFESLTEYQECLSMLKKDPVAFNQFDQLTGVGFARSRSWPLKTFMLHLPQLLGIYNNRIEFNESFFEEEYSKLEETFYSNEISFDVIVPLQGAKFSEPFKLEDNLEICLIKIKDFKPVIDDEIKKDEAYSLDDGLCWAIRTSYKLQKILGDDDLSSQERKELDEENDKIRNHANEIIEQVVAALRLYSYYSYRFSSIYPVAIVHRARSLLYPQEKPFRIRFFPDHSITWDYGQEFTMAFQEFWRFFQSNRVLDRKFINVAARRFSFAHERYSWEDKVLDLLIAAEALFFCDQKDINELRYRLSTRAAFFLADDSKTRKLIFRDFRTAYNLRSKIVHGSKKIEEVVSKIDKSEEYGIEGFVMKIQWYMCLAICKAITIANEPDSPRNLVEWDELVFNDRK